MRAGNASVGFMRAGVRRRRPLAIPDLIGKQRQQNESADETYRLSSSSDEENEDSEDGEGSAGSELKLAWADGEDIPDVLEQLRSIAHRKVVLAAISEESRKKHPASLLDVLQRNEAEPVPLLDTPATWNQEGWLHRRGAGPPRNERREQSRKIKRWFEHLDKDSNGCASADALLEPLIALGLARSRADVAELFESVGRESGSLTFDDFLALLQLRKGGSAHQEASVQARRMASSFKRMCDGELGDTLLAFPVLLTARRRSILLDATRAPPGSAAQVAGTELLEALVKLKKEDEIARERHMDLLNARQRKARQPAALTLTRSSVRRRRSVLRDPRMNLHTQGAVATASFRVRQPSFNIGSSAPSPSPDASAAGPQQLTSTPTPPARSRKLSFNMGKGLKSAASFQRKSSFMTSASANAKASNKPGGQGLLASAASFQRKPSFSQNSGLDQSPSVGSNPGAQGNLGIASFRARQPSFGVFAMPESVHDRTTSFRL